MAENISPIKSSRKVRSNIQKFESLTLKDTNLTERNHQAKPSSEKSRKSILEIDETIQEEPPLKIAFSQPKVGRAVAPQVQSSNVKIHTHHDSTVFIEQSYLNKPNSASLSDNAREILRCQPNHEDLVAVLQYLQFGVEGRHDFNVRVTSPKSAQIINVLVTVTIPDIWPNLRQGVLSQDEAQIKKTILNSLTSVSGIGALLVQIKQLLSSRSNNSVLSDTVMVLGAILGGHKTVTTFLQDAHRLYEKDSYRRLFWQEVTALLAGSRIMSTMAQVLSTNVDSNDSIEPCSWLGNGPEYVKWLARNINQAALKLTTTDEGSWRSLCHLVKRGQGLGYRDAFVTEIYTGMLLGQRALWTPLHLILTHLAPHEQRSFFDSVLSDLLQRCLAQGNSLAMTSSRDPGMDKAVAGAAALIAGLIRNNEILHEHVQSWLLGNQNSTVVVGLSTRRALVAALASSEDTLQRILERSLANFGDKLQIQHASILQQEATAQTILLLVGYLSRSNMTMLKQHSISTSVMQAVSNRLAASIPYTRLLGMIIGTAISKIVDKQENVIDFGAEEMGSEQVAQWLELVSIVDYEGDISDILSMSPNIRESKVSDVQHTPPVKHRRKSDQTQTSKIIAIEEVTDTSESEDGDLIPYRKPDSDPEDSEEDPTLINRNKLSAPVYVVDLIKQLQTTEKPDVVALALKTAPGLIRRKTGFGTELTDNVETLTTVLINLQDGMSDPDQQQLRLESLIACVIAKPAVLGPSLADVYFQGDFSLSQRITLLTAMGLSARELAGFNDNSNATPTSTFPSERLPAHLEPQPPQQISSTANPIAMLTNTAAHATVRPMAFAAADKMTGPSALKIRTFSSRMDVERKTQEKAAARAKTIPKNLHKLLTESFYLPLCSRMGLLLSHTMGGRLPNTTILHTSTLRLFLQTLTLLLNTLGASAGLHLSTLNHETLLLLLNLHTISYLSIDPAVLPAMLHFLLALLDITIEAGTTAQERLVTEYGPQLSELISWSNVLGDRISVPDGQSSEEGISWTVLAAGVQVKWFEIGKRFQSRMLGLSLDEMDQLASR